MSWWFILLASFVQGVTEFLPVSSSGHLLILSSLTDIGQNFEFYVLLNIGTLGALIWCSRTAIISLFKQARLKEWGPLLKIILSTLPVGLAGFFLTPFLKDLDNNLYLVITMLALLGFLMLFQPKIKNPVRALNEISWPKALTIGSAQILAFLPGTSRAGSTILTGIYLGLKQELAVTWSFLLAIPLVGGAILRVLISSDGARFVHDNFMALVVGNILAFGIGLLAFSFLINILKTKSLKPFGWYRLGLSLTLLCLLLLNVL